MEHDEEEALPLVYNPNNNRIDEIISRIGFGRYQVFLGLAISLQFFISGSIVTMMTVISYALEDDWDLSSSEVGVLSGSLLLGASLGFISSPFFESSFGRVKSLYISLVLLMVAGLIGSMMDGLWSLSTSFLFQGFFMAVSSLACLVLAIETCPSKLRGSFVMFVLFSFVLGQTFTVAFSLVMTSEFDFDYWRLLQIIISALVVPTIGILCLVGYESPLFLAKNREFNASMDVLNTIAAMNKTREITQGEMDYVYCVLPFYLKTMGSKFSVLFNRWHISLTMKTVLLSSASTVAYFGVNAVLPVALKFDEEDDTGLYQGMLVIYACQIPFVLMFVFFIDDSLFGRKNLIILSSTIICVSMVAIALFDDYHVMYALVLVSLGITYANACLSDLYVAEAFETELRVFVLGLANACSICMCSALILFFFHVNDSDEILLFVVLALLFGILILIGYLLPFDTTKTALDSRI